jgi:hypothetical protein
MVEDPRPNQSEHEPSIQDLGDIIGGDEEFE